MVSSPIHSPRVSSPEPLASAEPSAVEDPQAGPRRFLNSVYDQSVWVSLFWLAVAVGLIAAGVWLTAP